MHKLVSQICRTPQLFTALDRSITLLVSQFFSYHSFCTLESLSIQVSRMKLFNFFLAFVGHSVLGQLQEQSERPENWWKLQKIKQNRLERMQRKQMTSTQVVTSTTTSTSTTSTTAFIKPKKTNKKKSRRNRKNGKKIDYSTFFDLNTDNLALDAAASSAPKSPNDKNNIFSMSRSQGRGQSNGIHPNTRKIAGMLRRGLE